MGMQPFAVPQIEIGGRALYGAQIRNVRSVLGRNFLQSCKWRHGGDPCLPHVTVPFNRWLGMAGQ
jgi:hypothetical protein